MLFGIVVAVSVIGSLALGVALVAQKGREGLDLSPRSLLRLYLYIASLAGIVVLAGGIASLTTFALSGPFGRDAMYGSIPVFREPIVACPPGAPDCAKNIPNAEEQRQRAIQERDRRATEDLVRGITFTSLGAIFFGAHWAARRALGFDEPRSMLLRGYLMLGTLAFGLAMIILLPSGVTTIVTNAVTPVIPDAYRPPAGEQLGGGLVSLVLWLIYLRRVVRDFRTTA